MDLKRIVMSAKQRRTSKSSLLASISTASCSSPKELTQAVPPQEAVLTLKAIVRSASPMHVISLISPLSEVDFERNSSCQNQSKNVTILVTNWISLILYNDYRMDCHFYILTIIID